MRKRVIFILTLVVLLVLGYNYLYQDHRDINGEAPEYSLLSTSMGEEFASDPGISEQKYIDKTIQIKGTITELNDSDLTLDNVIFCQFNAHVNPGLAVGSSVSVKGRCIGYDDLLEQVKMNECTITD